MKNSASVMISAAVISVRDAAGNPVGAATISTTVEDRAVSLLTNARGDATFSNVAAGQYRYSVSKAGYYSPLSNMTLSITGGATTASKYVLFQYGKARVKVTSEGSTTAAGKTPFEGQPTTVNIANGQEATVTIPFVLNYGAVAVTVADKNSGAPIGGALVKVVFADGKVQSATTSSQGMATFSKVLAGHSTVEASKGDYAALYQKIGAYVPTSQTCQSTFSMYKICVNIGVTVKSTASQGGKAKFMCQKLGAYIVSVNKAGYSGSSKDVNANNMGMVYDLTMELPAAQ